MRKKTIKIVSLVLLVVFSVNSCCYAFLGKQNNALATQSFFQKTHLTEEETSRQLIFIKDVNLLNTACTIAKYLLSPETGEPKPIRSLYYFLSNYLEKDTIADIDVQNIVLLPGTA